MLVAKKAAGGVSGIATAWKVLQARPALQERGTLNDGVKASLTQAQSSQDSHFLFPLDHYL